MAIARFGSAPVAPPPMTSLEVQAEMPAWELRSTLNAVNNPKPVNPALDLKHGWTFERNVDYQGIISTSTYTIKYNNKYVAVFRNMQYPQCCGISILSDFSCNEELTSTDGFVEALDYFFFKTTSQWKPNIQFVAVKQAIREEIYDEEDDEYDDKIIGIEPEYDYNPLIVALCKVLKPTLLSSFINKNSDNQCDLYQAVNPYRE